MKRLLSAMFAGVLGSAAMAQSVTVGTSGADYTSLNAAIVAVGSTNDGQPDIITVLDEGPFLESRVIINSGVSGTDDLTIQASPGVRPIIVVNSTGAGKNSAVYLRKTGNLLFKDLIILPTTEGIVDQATYLDKVANDAVEIQAETGVDTSITLQNILVSSNDGNNNPIASLDGLQPPVFTDNTISFLDNGIYLRSSQTNGLRHVYMYDVVVSGVDSKILVDRYGPRTDLRPTGTDGIRGFIDGMPGSQWVLGAGSVISYNALSEDPHTSAGVRAAFQPGGTTGFEVRVEGTPDKPVKLINNNGNGIAVTNTSGAQDGVTTVEWCIIANNTGAGMNMQDIDTLTQITNVTIADNQDGAFRGAVNADEVSYVWSNVIAAGNGDATDLANVIRLVADGSQPGIFESTFTATDSAIVLEGPYTLNNVHYGGDGIVNDSKYIVTTSNITNSDPQFVSLDPQSEGFAVVSNQAYATAGPGGQPLVGGGSMAASSVEDWQLF